MMDADHLLKFKSINCTQMLLGQPVMSYAAPFVTVAFCHTPRAADYKRFQDKGWDVHGPAGHGQLPLNIHHAHFVEVTFKRNDPSAAVPVTY